LRSGRSGEAADARVTLDAEPTRQPGKGWQ
jgi:hypothetical protein